MTRSDAALHRVQRPASPSSIPASAATAAGCSRSGTSRPRSGMAPRSDGCSRSAAASATPTSPASGATASWSCPRSATDVVTHPEGNTPLLGRDASRTWAGVADLRLKHEGHNPTGSFKDRGMTVGVTQARRIGRRAVACASTGNTSASLAAYAAQAGMPALVFVPAGQVALGKLAQSLAYGATHAAGARRLRRLPPAGTGRQRRARRLPAQLDQSVPARGTEDDRLRAAATSWAGSRPDWIVLPAGNLGNTAAFGKALAEAQGARD